MAYEDMMAGGILAGAFLMLLFIALLSYIITSLSVMIIAQKTKTKYAWLAWIPIANIFLITNIARQPWWLALVIIFVNIVPILGGLVSVALMIFLFWKISEMLQKPGALSLLMLLPIVNLIYLLYLAFSDAKMKEKKKASPAKKKKK